MIDRDASTGLRIQFALGVLAFMAAAGLCAWLGLATLAAVLRRAAAQVPSIQFRPLYVTGLPMAAAFLALAVMALMPQRIVAKRPAGRRGISPANVIFGIVVGNILLAIATPLIARVAISGILRDRGYRECPAPDAERRPPMRWVHDGGKCP